MAPVKTYSAPDLEGPFLKWLLKHLRLQQKEGKGLDLHLHADNLGEKVSLHQVMALPRSELISDLATPGLPLDLHIPEAEGDSLNLLVKLLYGEATELPEEALPQLRSVCKALGLGNWLEEVLLTGKETQLEFYESKMVARKEENSEPPRDPLDLSDLTSTRRSSRLQPLQCKLCDSNHYSLTSLQSHYNKCHFSPTSGRSGKGRKASKLKSDNKCNWSTSSSHEKELFSVQTTTNALLSDIGSGTGKQCKVHLTNLRNRDEVSIEVLGKREGLGLQLSKLAKGRNAVELGDLLQGGADLSVEVSSKAKKTAGLKHNAEAQDEHDGCDPNNNSVFNLDDVETDHTEQGILLSCDGPSSASVSGRDESVSRQHQRSFTSKLRANGLGLEDWSVEGTARKINKKRAPSASRSGPRQNRECPVEDHDNQCNREELFFPLWNKFLTKKVVPGSGRLSQHLPFALKTFFSLNISLIKQQALLPQALKLVSNLVADGLLSKKEASNLEVMLHSFGEWF